MGQHEEESPVASLGRAMALCRALVAEVGPDQWDRPTPCTDWSVRDLVRHVGSGNRQLTKALGDAAAEPSGGSADSPADLAEEFATSIQPLLDAVAAPGAMQRTVTVPFGTVPVPVAVHLRTTEALVHGWDVASASGLPFDVPESLAEAELTFSRGTLASLPPGHSAFGTPQQVAEDAPAVDRLAALLGRPVPWPPQSPGGVTEP